MFQHLCVILREFQNLYFAKLHKFLKLKLLKLQVHKIIRLIYYLIILWNCSFKSFNSKNLGNLAAYKFWNSLRMTQRCQKM